MTHCRRFGAFARPLSAALRNEAASTWPAPKLRPPRDDRSGWLERALLFAKVLRVAACEARPRPSASSIRSVGVGGASRERVANADRPLKAPHTHTGRLGRLGLTHRSRAHKVNQFAQWPSGGGGSRRAGGRARPVAAGHCYSGGRFEFERQRKRKKKKKKRQRRRRRIVRVSAARERDERRGRSLWTSPDGRPGI